jgi:cyanophycinase-like exopeptidase
LIVALAGSGEFLPSMADVDREILRLAPGDRVAILPTAAGLEDPAAWGRMGVTHFEALGARAIHVPLHGREDASDPAIHSALSASDVFYLSGGQPDHLIDSLLDSPAWDVISSRLAAGAAIAGCSAGAMALAGVSIRVAVTPWGWGPGLGLLPGWAVLPHFDRVPERPGAIDELLAAPPQVEHLVGIDEDTVLVWDGESWGVRGPGRVVDVRTELESRAPSRLSLPPPRSPVSA